VSPDTSISSTYPATSSPTRTCQNRPPSSVTSMVSLLHSHDRPRAAHTRSRPPTRAATHPAAASPRAVDVPHVVHDVVQKVPGERVDRERGTIAAPTLPRPRVVRHRIQPRRHGLTCLDKLTEHHLG